MTATNWQTERRLCHLVISAWNAFGAALPFDPWSEPTTAARNLDALTGIREGLLHLRAQLRLDIQSAEGWTVINPPAPILFDREQLAAIELGATTILGRAPIVAHSPDFTSVAWNGEPPFTFTPTQAAAIKFLWELTGQGTPSASEAEILNHLEKEAMTHLGDRPLYSNASRLRDVFRKGRGKHPAWGTFIVSAGKGLYRLAIDA